MIHTLRPRTDKQGLLHYTDNDMLTIRDYKEEVQEVIIDAVERLRNAPIKTVESDRIPNIDLWTELNAHFQSMSIQIFTRLVQRRLGMTEEYVKRILEFRGDINDAEQTFQRIENLSRQCEHYERHFPTWKDLTQTCPSACEPQVSERRMVLYAWRNTFFLLKSYQNALDADKNGNSRVILHMLSRMTPSDLTDSHYLSSLRCAIIYAKNACDEFSTRWTEIGLPDLTLLTKSVCRCKFDTIRHCIDEHVRLACDGRMNNIPIKTITHLWHLISALANLCGFYERIYGDDDLVKETKLVGVDRVKFLGELMHHYIAPVSANDAFKMIGIEAPYRHWADLFPVLAFFPGAGECLFVSFSKTVCVVCEYLKDHTRLLFSSFERVIEYDGPELEKFEYFCDRIREITIRLYHSRNSIVKYSASISHPKELAQSIVAMEDSLREFGACLTRCTIRMFESNLFSQYPQNASNVIQACLDNISGILASDKMCNLANSKELLDSFFRGVIHSLPFRNRSLRVSCLKLLHKCHEEEYVSCGTLEAAKQSISLPDIMVEFDKQLDFATPLVSIPTLEERIMNRRREAGLAGRVIPNASGLQPTGLESQFISESIPVGFNWYKLCKLGDGPCGTVYNALVQSTKKIVAVKEIFINDSFDASGFKTLMEHYVQLRDNHVLKYYGFDRKKERVSIVMDLCGAASLAKALQMGPIEDANLLKTYSVQILLGLAYLHSHNIVHKNLKPENVLMDIHGTVKLCDFGRMIPIAIRNKTVVTGVGQRANRKNLFGSPEFMAPELLIGEKFGPSADIWSFACLVLFMITGKRPFEELESDRSVLYNVTTLNRAPYIPGCLEGPLRVILNSCLQRDPSLRPTVQDLLTDPFFSNTTIPCSE